MKANELMIGDLVRVTEDVCIKKGTIVKIVGIDATRTLPKLCLVGCALCTPLNHDDGLYGGYGGVWTAFLEPIPLTAEILEKNGFEQDEVLRNMYFWNWNVIGDNISYDKETGKVRIFKGANLLFVRVLEYVHELQHAMKLCGIKKDVVI